jgi:hypothetical protein
MSAKLPNAAGQSVVFPSVQTYSSGEVVRWIGAADADTPAPRVLLTAAGGEHETAAPATAAEESEDDDGVDYLALGFGIAGLVAGGAALAVSLLRRPRGA